MMFDAILETIFEMELSISEQGFIKDHDELLNMIVSHHKLLTNI